jgi:plasmid stabilization system protein ParE
LAVRAGNWDRGLRSLAFGNYLIFYRKTANGIEVVRVVHGARRLEALSWD